MLQLPPMPPNIERLPRDDRGYPVPWFVAWLNGKADFRFQRTEALAQAVRGNLCWLCGKEFLDNILAFVIGPMCAVNRTTSEPPCHLECARFSAMACPFLTMPKAQRREAAMPANTIQPAGISLRRNPGVALIYICSHYRTHKVQNRGHGARDGILIALPKPQRVEWYAEGRAATRAEVLESIDTGLPILRGMAEEEGPEAIEHLNRLHREAIALLPLEAIAS
jgi:hypothetical protein